MGFLKNILIKYNIISWRIFQKPLINSYKNEINNYTAFLKEHDDNFISTWLADAILFRVDLENEGTLPSLRLEDDSICPELIGLVPLWSSLQECLNVLGKSDNERTSFMILSLWYYTVLSLIKPDLLNDGKEMWNELKRGLKNTDDEIRRIIAKRYSDNPTPRMRAYDILRKLPPKQFNFQDACQNIIFQCDSCGQKLRIPLKTEPIRITCPSCKNVFICENGKKS